VIQQAPLHKTDNILNIYKILFDRGQLTNANLNTASISRQDYIKQQAKVEELFAKFKQIRGLTFIYIDDVICNDEVCPIGTGEHPFVADALHMIFLARSDSRLDSKNTCLFNFILVCAFIQLGEDPSYFINLSYFVPKNDM
jgi:hypothetical protein